MTYLNTSEKVKVENYPYGFRLKTDKFYSIEFKNKKGFRLVEQTLNPKTGLLNKPKKSTYDTVKILINIDGRIKTHSEDFYDDEGKNKGWEFMFKNFQLFTKEENKYIILQNLMLLKMDIQSKCTYCNSDHKKMFPLYDKAIKTLVRMAKEGVNLWNEVVIDWEAVEALEEKGSQPFKLTSYGLDSNPTK